MWYSAVDGTGGLIYSSDATNPAVISSTFVMLTLQHHIDITAVLLCSFLLLYQPIGANSGNCQDRVHADALFVYKYLG